MILVVLRYEQFIMKRKQIWLNKISVSTGTDDNDIEQLEQYKLVATRYGILLQPVNFEFNSYGESHFNSMWRIIIKFLRIDSDVL